MRNTGYFTGKKVTVIGLARSGLACANLLYRLGAQVAVTDSKPRAALQDAIAHLESSDILVECGGHSEEYIIGRDMVVLSPGIPDEAPPVRWALKHNIPVYSEIETAWTVCPGTVIAVTGSNGKTTTTTLMGSVINAAGKHAVVCGNIGNPFSGEVSRLKPGDYVVLEVSSFQLEKIKTFKPYIAIITNINPNHLDRYKDMQEYIDAKKRIFLNQDSSDYLIVNKEDRAVAGIAGEAGSKIESFCEEPGLNPNQAAVVKAAAILGIRREVCAKVFRDFKGLEHRMEEVCRINQVTFINDSKATTVESTMWALRNIPTHAVLIAGGKDKGLDYRLIRDLAGQKVRSLVLIGQAARKIKKALEDTVPVDEARDLQDAVIRAYNRAEPGDCVLLSPMCSSYDMFADYEERGRVFKKIVRDLETATLHALKPSNNRCA
jgi:UDP-N-acetylmuramoylalanine--D-glutamate ligase